MSDLILTARTGQVPLLRHLLEADCSANVTDQDGATPLYWAACSGHEDAAKLLIGFGANVNATVKWGSTPLHAAADRGQEQCVKTLLQNGALTNEQNHSGDTPLHLAAYRGYLKIVKLLLHNGADPHRVNSKGKTPLQEARSNGKYDVVAFLAPRTEAGRPLGSTVFRTHQKNRLGSSPNKTFPLDYSAIESGDSVISSASSQPHLNKNLYLDNKKKNNERWQQTGFEHRPMSEYNVSPGEVKRYENTLFYDKYYEGANSPGRGEISNRTDGFVSVGRVPSSSMNSARVDLRYIEETQVRIATLESENVAKDKAFREEKAKKDSLLAENELLKKQNDELRRRDNTCPNIEKSRLNLRESPAIKEEANSESDNLSMGLSSLVLGKSKITSETDSELPTCCQLFRSGIDRGSHQLYQVLNQLQETLDHEKGKLSSHLFSLSLFNNMEPSKTLLDDPGREWELGKDFTLIDDRPLNYRTDGQKNGSCSLVFRIKYKENVYVLKMMWNVLNLWYTKHGMGQSMQPYLSDQFGAEHSIPTKLPFHMNVIPVLHHYYGSTEGFRQFLPLFVPRSIDVPLEMARNTLFVVMPFFQKTLKDVFDEWWPDLADPSIGRERPNSESFILPILLQVLKAVEHILNNNVVHRDIKADNILVSCNGQVALCDFGFARRLVSESAMPIPFVEKEQVFAGNPSAWAPELVKYNREGPPSNLHERMTLLDVYQKSDIFAVGQMFHSILSTKDTEEFRWTDKDELDKNSPDFPEWCSSEMRALFKSMLCKDANSRIKVSEAVKRASFILFGPKKKEVFSKMDCQVYLQAKILSLTILEPDILNDKLKTSDTYLLPSSKEEGSLRLEIHPKIYWKLCRDFVESFSADELWRIYQIVFSDSDE